MYQYLELLGFGAIALFLSFCIFPLLRKIAFRIGLVDKPSGRKVHQMPVPLVGGIGIAIAAFSTIFLSSAGSILLNEYLIVIVAAAILLGVGVIDDRFDIPHGYRLIIQLICAFAVVNSGILITSFYGIFGIGELSYNIQCGLTMVVIMGVVNAFNLIDGVDGLLGGIALLGFSILLGFACRYEQSAQAFFYVACIGATIGFLFFNLRKDKIFMGDAGSLAIGFILVVSALDMLQIVGQDNSFNPGTFLPLIISIFLIPVLDALRVFLGRMLNGNSPFQADKSHIHHLLLLTGLNHISISLVISGLSILILLFGLVLPGALPLTSSLLLIVLPFLLLTKLLFLNKEMLEWKGKIKRMEEPEF